MNCFKKIPAAFITVLLIFTAILAFSSCANDKAELNSSIKYISEEDYLSGDIDGKLKDSIEVAVGKKCYAVIDYTLYGSKKLDKKAQVLISLSSNDGALFEMGVEELPTPDYEKKNNTLTASFKVKGNGEEGRLYRFIVALNSEGAGSVAVSARFSIIDFVTLDNSELKGKIEINQDILTESKLEYRLSDDGTYYVIEGLGDDGGEVVTIPTTYDGLPVKEIAPNAFSGTSYLKEVYFLEGAEKIGREAFKGCTSLKSIIIPSSVRVIENNAFMECGGINIYCEASEGAISWTDVASLTDANVIYDADELFSLNADGKSYTFSFSSVNFSDLHVPSAYKKLPITAIANNAFKGCTSLKSVTLPKNVTSIGDDAFFGCASLVSVEMPERLYSIGSHAFSGCVSLKSIDIPDKVTSIRDYTFSGCVSLISVGMPEDLTSIGMYAFRGCTSLLSITLPSNVSSIGTEAFADCKKLVEVINNSSLQVIKGSWEHGGVAAYSLDAYLKVSKIENKDGFIFYSSDGVIYLLAYVGEETEELILPSSFNGGSYSIYSYAFYGNNFKSIVIPKKVTGIGSYAFYYCSGIYEIKYRGTNAEFWDISKERYWISDNQAEFMNYTYNYTGQ